MPLNKSAKPNLPVLHMGFTDAHELDCVKSSIYWCLICHFQNITQSAKAVQYTDCISAEG